MKKSANSTASHFDFNSKKNSELKKAPLKESDLKEVGSALNKDSLDTAYPLLKQKKTSIRLSSFFQEIQKKYDEKNKEQLLSIENQQDLFKSSGQFSFLVNVFSDEEKAFEYIKKIKQKYPFWSFLLKVHGDHIRIYLGPFNSKKEALDFKKDLPMPYPFSSLEYLEKVGL